MSINDLVEKVKLHASALYTIVLLIVVASIFFGLGRLSALEEKHVPIKITYPNATSTQANNLNQTSAAIQSVVPSSIDQSASGEVIGSLSGKKYYFPWCGTIKRVKPENQVHFASIDDARAAGYLPAANCKGLK